MSFSYDLGSARLWRAPLRFYFSSAGMNPAAPKFLALPKTFVRRTCAVPLSRVPLLSCHSTAHLRRPAVAGPFALLSHGMGGFFLWRSNLLHLIKRHPLGCLFFAFLLSCIPPSLPRSDRSGALSVICCANASSPGGRAKGRGRRCPSIAALPSCLSLRERCPSAHTGAERAREPPTHATSPLGVPPPRRQRHDHRLPRTRPRRCGPRSEAEGRGRNRRGPPGPKPGAERSGAQGPPWREPQPTPDETTPERAGTAETNPK